MDQFRLTPITRGLQIAGLILSTTSVALAAPQLPSFAGATFLPGAAIDHPYFPLMDNAVRTFSGQTVDEDGDPIVDSFELKRLGAGPTILGVQATTQLDRAFVDGLLDEETFDYYAQDTAGNVWYLGEDVTNYVYDGEDSLITTNSSSSWRAGVNDALPGFIMPANTTLGFNYYQEFAAADAALDQGRIQGHLDQIVVDAGTFFDVLQIWEGTELDPTVGGFKYYARGFGLILEDEHLDAQLRNPEFSKELVSVSAVPIPAALPLLGSALFGTLFMRRRVSVQARTG